MGTEANRRALRRARASFGLLAVLGQIGALPAPAAA